jgi:peptide/nickel transport system permease protein
MLESIPLILAVIVFNFVLIHVAPGDPTAIMIQGSGQVSATPEFIQGVKARYGLDRPLQEQLMIYVGNVLRGDLGYSFFRSKPVVDVILERVPATLLLVVTSEFAAIVVGTLLGVVSVRKFASRTDAGIQIASSVMYSMPAFWTGLVLLLVFSFQLRLFPSSGIMSPVGENRGSSVDVLQHLFLPFLALFISEVPIFIRTARSSVLEVLHEDFVTTFRAIGLPENRVLFKHALKNALLPTITVAGMLLGFVLTGAVFVETVFGWPGLGRTMYEAVIMRDYPLLMGMFIFVSVCVIGAVLITDILYVYVDPRVKYR